MRAIANGLHRFKSDEEGAIAVVFGLIAIMFVSFGGISVDLARTYAASSRADAALDSAILAAGDARNRGGLNDAEVTELAERFFRANISGAGNRSNEFSNFRLNITGDGNTFTGQVDVSVPMLFAGLVSLDQIDFTASTSATFDQLDLELGLMLDVTGSMNSNVPGSASSKLDALKRAVSQDLLDSLLPNGDNPRIRVGYAPYSSSVNVGSLVSAVLPANVTPSDNCVVERETGIGSDAAPSSGFFRTYDQANTTIVDDQGAPGYGDNANRPGNGYYQCPPAEVLPLTTSKSNLVQTINDYEASGRTGGHMGVAWAWYLVSPNWASIWGGNSAPKPYNTPDLIKAVVLLTDGSFNTSYLGTDDADSIGNGIFTGEAVDNSYNNADQLCENMKGENVVVYSIGFALDDPRASDALRDCASTDSQTGQRLFFASANETQLREAFQEIARSLTNLRLTR